MGFLNTLANIGITVGKAALSILSGGKSIVLEDGGTLTLHDYKVKDINFYTEQINGKKEVYIYNTSNKINYMVTLPNTNGKEGEIIYLNATEIHPITEWFLDKQSPETKIQVSQVDEKSGISNDKTSKLNLSFNQLQINGEPVVIGGIKIYALKDGIRVECKNAMGLKEMQFCMLRNDKGVSLVQNDPVPPSVNNNAEETRFYPIEYAKFGLSDNDKVSGVVNINLQDKTRLPGNCKRSFSSKHIDRLNTLLADRS